MQLIYLLKDIALRSGCSIYTLKYYLKLGLIQEIGRSPETRFRYFDDTTVVRLQRIRELRRANQTLTDIKNILGSGLRAQGSAPSPEPPARSIL